jgi:exosortase C (VPDSG-CTERM-specific)
MNKPQPVLAQVAPQPIHPRSPHRWRAFLVAILVVILGFGLPLIDLLTFAFHNDLYSHIILIPFVSLYLVWLKRSELPVPSAPHPFVALLAFSLGALALILYWIVSRSDVELAREDRLAFQIVAFVSVLTGTCARFLGRRTLVAISFPLGFLLFMVPFPVAVMDGIESFFQHSSAVAAAAFFKLAGTPFFRNETFFQLPGINLQVAPECSGIRSSLALFITSLVAGNLFLRSPFRRVILALVVIPLGILRNGFRILVIGELCVHLSPDMIDSYIHHKGGPIFFALSLVPFSLLLLLLLKLDRRSAPAITAQTPAAW